MMKSHSRVLQQPLTQKPAKDPWVPPAPPVPALAKVPVPMTVWLVQKAPAQAVQTAMRIALVGALACLMPTVGVG